MRTLKPVLGVIGALLPVLYCGYLLYFFLDGTTVQEAKEIGLGPTLLGLGIVGLLFTIAVIVKVALIFSRSRPPESDGRGGPKAPAQDDEGTFDADAVLARYMARRSTEAGPDARVGGESVTPQGFGRRIR